jgi:hypothetical protein
MGPDTLIRIGQWPYDARRRQIRHSAFLSFAGLNATASNGEGEGRTDAVDTPRVKMREIQILPGCGGIGTE